MKTFFLSLKTFAFVAIALGTFSLTSCKDKDDATDELLQDQITGTWNVNSYLVDETEYIGLAFNSAQLSFEKKNGNEGEFEQHVTFLDGEHISVTGTYTVDNATHQILMQYEEDLVLAKITITGNHMVWDGTEDGYPLVLKADKQ